MDRTSTTESSRTPTMSRRRGLRILATGLLTTTVYGVMGTAAEAAPVTAPLASARATSVFDWEEGPCLRDWPNLTRGSRGLKVQAVQLLLTDRGVPTVVDGIYGPATARSVARFQWLVGLPRSGVMTNRTFERLLPTVEYGDRGREVRAVQKLLGLSGHRVVVDGIFGPRTQAAVRARQSETHITINGVVDNQTWFSLMWRDLPLSHC